MRSLARLPVSVLCRRRVDRVVVVRVVGQVAVVVAVVAPVATADGVFARGAALRVMHFLVVHLEMNSLQ